MNPEVQQRVLGYFIEESQDHLATLERGLLALGTDDPTEILPELFRAAHSIKGGAALLGITSLRHIAHELEDHFRVIQETNRPVEQELESRLLKVVDILQGLVNTLQTQGSLNAVQEAEAETQAQPLMQQLAVQLATQAEPSRQEANQARILSYFIEESNDHLKTLEQGLMAWRQQDSLELLQELFRAAHSIKGGAAMLGLPAVRRVAHELEDCFRIVEERALGVDETLEGLLLQALDSLRDLVGYLETQGRITPEQDREAQTRFQPILEQLNRYLAQDYEAPSALVELLPARSLSRFTPDQQRIVGYFIEETREHLTTLGEGLPRLHLFSDDPEFLPGLYRAAHSVKGGAAMLGLEGIRQVAYQLEQHLRTLNEADQIVALATQQLFITACAHLEAMVIQLAAASLTIEKEQELLVQAGPALAQLTQAMAPAQTTEPATVPALADLVPAPAQSEPPLLTEEVRELVLRLLGPSLQQVQEYLNQASFDEVREPLLTLTREFCELGEIHGLRNWVDLNQTLAMALIYHGDDSWSTLSPQASRELTTAYDLLTEGKHWAIQVSESLRSLADPARTLPLVVPALADLVPTAATLSPETDILANLFGRGWNDETPVKPKTTIPRTKATGTVRRMMRVEVRHLDGLSNLVGELIINRNSLESQQNRLRLLLETLQQRVGQLNRISQELEEFYDKSIQGVRGYRVGGTMASSGGRAGFDALEMDQYTPLHSISQEVMELIVRIKEVGSDIEFVTDQAEEATRQFRQLSSQLQEGLNQMRMLPLSEIVDRLPRAVRDLSVSLGKQVDLEIQGRDTLVDKAILEELYDPLTHLTTNALMHGIEEPQQRIQAGKQTKGRVEIKASHQGNQTIISISDDGEGLKAAKIREKAVAKGLLSAQEAQDLSDNEVYPLVFLPGFSTAERITEVAGRGVGLDVVQNHINRLRGTIQLDSKPGVGTTFTIRLPLTLSISRAIICRNGRTPIAFPLDGIEDLVEVPVDSIQPSGNNRTIQWRERTLPFLDLNDVLVYGRTASRDLSDPSKEVATVILHSGDNYVALGVDAFIEEQEVVIKQLKGAIPKPQGIAGVTILGNGQVLPIADVGELITMTVGQLPAQRAQIKLAVPDVNPTGQTAVLIVDDSITVRELLSMTFIKAGYRVEQARDGQEALDKLKSGFACDLVFCDVEMPRMDGFEFLSQLQKDGRLQNLPVAMLTSRSAEKHRQTAYQLGAKGYFTKPYLEDDLLRGAEQLLRNSRLAVKV
ncbi:Hpt domain-containing protein [Candidatus Cyanaurora vandensis]|uniref:hybrid sensor histidine kinase/response regulator n=1 Tax=Candidatus Cyanaurora vandensis TaxID=2714958 RepID=UPI00257A049A|nr:Hpt domain-containing protein [Candidatus Cyanaurora vandensis]